jgi:nucleoid-associated protein YgaU
MSLAWPTSATEWKPTDNPRPKPQPATTPQPEPTEQRPHPTAPPKPRRAEQAQASPDASHTSPAASSYTSQPGDSFYATAERIYRSADDWKALYDANRGNIGGNPNLIHPGTELDIPPKD